MNCAIRYAAAARTAATGMLYLQCHVKPGASKAREGIVAVTEDAVEMCVAAQARDGEANQAVIDVLCKILDVSKLQLSIARGLKSRNKIVTVTGMVEADGKSGELVESVRRLLTDAAAKV